MTFKIQTLDAQNTPVALSLLIAGGGLLVGSFAAGYMVGKDLAN